MPKPSVAHVDSRGVPAIDHDKYQEWAAQQPDNDLRSIIKDAKEAIEANPDNPKNSYYADEIAYAGMELAKRERPLREAAERYKESKSEPAGGGGATPYEPRPMRQTDLIHAMGRDRNQITGKNILPQVNEQLESLMGRFSNMSGLPTDQRKSDYAEAVKEWGQSEGAKDIPDKIKESMLKHAKRYSGLSTAHWKDTFEAMGDGVMASRADRLLKMGAPYPDMDDTGIQNMVKRDDWDSKSNLDFIRKNIT